MPPEIGDHIVDSKELKILTKEINPPLSWDKYKKCQREIYRKRWEGDQRRIGITGGIASGKSVIGKYLKEKKNLPILDADIYARKILSPGAKVTKAVIKHFGDIIIDKKNLQKSAIHRDALRDIIFSNKIERLWLEKLLHPIIKSQLEEDLKLMKRNHIVIMLIPLLFEANLTNICSEVWLVNCSIEEQLKRLKMRDNFSKDKAEKIINSQMPFSMKKEMADVIINNDKGMEDLEKEIEIYL